jgi:hypothetical protein
MRRSRRGAQAHAGWSEARGRVHPAHGECSGRAAEAPLGRNGPVESDALLTHGHLQLERVARSGSYPNLCSASWAEMPRATAMVVHDRPA